MYCCAWCRHFRNTEKEGSDGYCFIDGTEVRLEDVCDEFEIQEVKEGKRGNKMTNREWLNSLSDEKLAEKLLPPHCECEYCIINAECNHICGNCYDKIVEWLKQKHIKPMPELKLGDIIIVLLDKGLINKIVVGLIVMSDKHASNINGVMYNLEDLNIRTIKRMNNTNERVEIIWRADDE